MPFRVKMRPRPTKSYDTVSSVVGLLFPSCSTSPLSLRREQRSGMGPERELLRRLRTRSWSRQGKNSQVFKDNEAAAHSKSNGLNGFSIFWGGLVRIDVLKVLPETCLTFYRPKGLQIHVVPTENAADFYQKEVGVLLTPPTERIKAENWKGLESEHNLKIKFEDAERPACDVAVSGLGWFTVEPVGKSHRISETICAETCGELHLAVRVPKPVEIFVRPALPVGKFGAEWYQYRELTEKEEETRPKWYF